MKTLIRLLQSLAFCFGILGTVILAVNLVNCGSDQDIIVGFVVAITGCILGLIWYKLAVGYEEDSLL